MPTPPDQLIELRKWAWDALEDWCDDDTGEVMNARERIKAANEIVAWLLSAQ